METGGNGVRRRHEQEEGSDKAADTPQASCQSQVSIGGDAGNEEALRVPKGQCNGRSKAGRGHCSCFDGPAPCCRHEVADLASVEQANVPDARNFSADAEVVPVLGDDHRH